MSLWASKVSWYGEGPAGKGEVLFEVDQVPDLLSLQFTDSDNFVDSGFGVSVVLDQDVHGRIFSGFHPVPSLYLPRSPL